MSRNLKILITVGFAICGVGLIVYNSLGDVSYYVHVNDVVANPTKWEGKNIQVHGFAVPGTIEEHVIGQRTERSFEIEYCKKSISVHHAGSKPDTFKDQAETVVTGTLVNVGGKWMIEAVEGERGIAAKCPSKYEQRQAPKCPPETAER